MATPLSPDRLLTALRAEGVTVHEHSGWRTHNRDAATGRAFGPVYGVLIHHTAGHNDRELCFNGRADLPGPLCHAWLGKTDGLWLLGNGRTNHAGSVDGDVVRALMAEASPLPRDDEADTDGNDCLYGLEIENLGNGQDPYPAVQYDTAVRWAAALCRAHGWSERSVAGHKEVQPGKVDPSFDMNVFRAAVAARLAHEPGWNPNEETDVPLTTADVRTTWLTDGVVKNPNPATNKDNPYIAPATALNNIETIARRTDARVAALTEVNTKLVDTVAQLAAGLGDIDPASIVAELKSAIESIDVHLSVDHPEA
ncbi:MAG: N-acetylmuramoyl-L-alanine amidase [Streptomyces sp.]|nr:N-acetylmuramoyl-L-alanine amidase [Streptomyces sp.]